jgi:hypothetical protein
VIAPLVVLAAAAVILTWLARKARTTAADVIDESKGPTAGAHLPSLHPEVRDAMPPRSLAVDIETERYRSSGPNAAGG